MTDSILASRPTPVGPTDLHLPPTQPIDISALIRTEEGQ